ncbi:conserved hypothetical protein [Leishmania major strain Friedlin]|uniref:Uncharacterized protein n=1 Tax=Leishmania major TaxID=5664 RepID=Q4QC83_LEIMA|nr:conserved hypothetical protein [Leishmania major strain Friedlin]CAG9573494.1 hypothetical_protein_-_conserved [Leishmania major strain Friedlin]CAJ04582.1 conserved hypothetical protein [Leishmania major strain Friedlin]|eukprot:XP_001683065.1 conserved hypothetical protein [Leishmania major strain Friedlin]
MFTRVGAFLEAIDKKTEELANAVDEEDLARTAGQRLHSSSGVSRNTSLQQHPQPPLCPARGHDSGVFHESRLGGLPRSRGNAAGSSSDDFQTAGTPPSVMISSAHVASDKAYAAGHVPLSLPTKLPSFRPSTQDPAIDGGRGGVAAGWKQHLTASTVADPFPGNDLASSQGDAAIVSSAALGGGETPIHNISIAEAAVERLKARCKALEADKTRWQQEAATHRAQCSAARDALWKAEQDTRASRAAQRAAEQALTVYKETSQRLLDEAHHELKQARDAAAGRSSATEPQQQTDASHDARELHQRLELLQADHASLNAEVERYRQEAAKATAELQHMQERHRQAQMRVDMLQLEVGAARESLEGEVSAHADTRSALRRLQTQKDELVRRGSSPSLSAAVAQGTGEAGPAVDVGPLQRELNELKQRHQLLTLQASNLQAALDAAAREATDMKARYNELAKHVNDAEVEMAAGFRASAIYENGNGCSSVFPAPPTTSSMRGHRGPNADRNGLGGHSAAAGAPWAHYPGAAATTPESSGDARRRNPAMVRLAREYGIAGRAVVAVVSSIDSFAVQVGRVLTQARWMWRVALMCYIGLLQVWVVLMIIGTLALEDSAHVQEMAKVPEPL